jgi:pyrimidine operon attenuation protein/uracil phosphoribosyltransferase
MTQGELRVGPEDIARIIRRMADDLVAHVATPKDAVVVGIRTHGVTLARRLHRLLADERKWDLPLGILDTTIYRDDLSQLGQQPVVRETNIEFDVTDKVVILVDDVLYTGRTARCALDAIMDFGRPRRIVLAALVDRGLRELPIQPDVAGIAIQTTHDEIVEVHFTEGEGEDGVWVRKAPHAAT